MRSVKQSNLKNERLLVKIEVKSMQILHTITKTESGYILKIWEPAELTKDRVRPFLWELNLSAATTEEFDLVLEQINLLHQYHSEALTMIPLLSPNLTTIGFGQGADEAIGHGECTTCCLST